jgi:8-amino-7-oxononanoate synthase
MVKRPKPLDAEPASTRLKRLSQEARKKARARFLAPFEPLLEQIDVAHRGEVYPFYGSADSAAAPADGSAGMVVLVANDYLGLTADPRVRAAAIEAIERYGTSRCASPLAGGHTSLHRDLEDHLADFLEQEAAVLFASGYQANVGAISALVGKDDLILTDLFNHASIVDGSRLSGAQVRHFQHNNPGHLEAVLRREGKGRRALVVAEGIYSADGDIALLPDLCDVAHKHGALVMIDEAHSLGVLGEKGCGAAEFYGLLEEVDVIMGTMSKSLASVGGFLAADRRIIDAVAHSARSLIFSAALPPAGVAAAHAALRIIESEPGLRERLWQNTRFFLTGLQDRGFDTMDSETPVIPVRVGEPMRAVEFAAALRKHDILVCPAIPPMVPRHLSRVRAHITARHHIEALGDALETIDGVARALGLIDAQAPARAAAESRSGRILKRA